MVSLSNHGFSVGCGMMGLWMVGADFSDEFDKILTNPYDSRFRNALSMPLGRLWYAISML